VIRDNDDDDDDIEAETLRGRPTAPVRCLDNATPRRSGRLRTLRNDDDNGAVESAIGTARLMATASSSASDDDAESTSVSGGLAI
jgi:hypothetical protein